MKLTISSAAMVTLGLLAISQVAFAQAWSPNCEREMLGAAHFVQKYPTDIDGNMRMINKYEQCKAELKETEAVSKSLPNETTEEYNARQQEWKAEQARREEIRHQQYAAEQAERARVAKLPGVAIGMTKQQVLTKTHWGKPEHINTTSTRYGTHEQWVYDGNQYIYFDNGKVSGIQTSR